MRQKPRFRHAHAVESIGILSAIAPQQVFEQARSELQKRTGTLPGEERAAIASYLRAGAIVFAIMEHTTDVLEGAFGVPGGSGVRTDGAYYWRGDAADYVERYCIAPSDDFLSHGRALQWSPRPMAEEDIAGVYDYLMANMRQIRRARKRHRT
ncbi:hypothetical protein [Chondromyces crocatus]|uniref:Uncharacterized protein n=1 Tax=Chondromyces crocatus TaxID=52 RepID=A0A0K1ERB2_CHOCO|nr:hypothetical protein [Chondromyces crocatus]AKT43470.1 uncharacterized protein CMC5_077020 [Chondromyces crocatus]